MDTHFTRRRLLCALSLMPAARLLGQQDPPPAASPAAPPGQPSTFATDVKVVNVLATVRDKKGAIVRNLTKDDFILDEDGHPEVIRYFAAESDLPLTLGLLVDTSRSQLRVINDERSASYTFFDQVLREDRDLAFVIHFDFQVELLEDLTPSRQKLEKALDALQVADDPQQQNGGNSGGGYPNGGGYPSGGGGGRRYGGGTKLYDAVLLASNELMKKQKGRKALILLTDGVDHGSKTSLFSAIEAAQRTDTLIYAILFAGPNESYGYPPGMGHRRMGMGYPGGGYPGGGYPGGGYPGGGGGGSEHGDGKKVLEQMARETGGGFFEVSHSHPIDKVFAAIEEDLRNQYSIGYTSDQAASGAYRHIHLTAKPKGLVVQAREGYYST